MANPFKDWSMERVEAHNRKFGGQGVKGLTPDAPVKKPRKPAYTKEQVVAWCLEHGLPSPVFELVFHPTRKWRFDVAFHNNIEMSPVAIEIQGGLWIKGGHNRGAQMKKDWEKLHEAQILGWKVVYCEPKDLLTPETATIVKRLLES